MATTAAIAFAQPCKKQWSSLLSAKAEGSVNSKDSTHLHSYQSVHRRSPRKAPPGQKQPPRQKNVPVPAAGEAPNALNTSRHPLPTARHANLYSHHIGKHRSRSWWALGWSYLPVLTIPHPSERVATALEYLRKTHSRPLEGTTHTIHHGSSNPHHQDLRDVRTPATSSAPNF